MLWFEARVARSRGTPQAGLLALWDDRTAIRAASHPSLGADDPIQTRRLVHRASNGSPIIPA